jgi:hypothetical protein
MEIDELFIENIVNSYENVDIWEDEAKNVKNIKFVNAIAETIGFVVSLGEGNSILLYKDKIDREIPLIKIDRDIIGSNLFFSLFISTYDYILRKYYKEDQYLYVISNLMKHSIEIYQDVLSSILTKSFDGILARIRAIYETWVIQEFIMRNKQLAINFREHKKIIALRLGEEMGRKLTKKEEKMKIELQKKYGDDFINEFGWLSSIIGNIKKRNIQGIVNYLNLDSIKSFNYIYKITCQFVHTTSVSIFSEKEENIEMIETFYIKAVEMIIYIFINFMDELSVKEKDKIVLMTLFVGIMEEIKDMK